MDLTYGKYPPTNKVVINIRFGFNHRTTRQYLTLVMLISKCELISIDDFYIEIEDYNKPNTQITSDYFTLY